MQTWGRRIRKGYRGWMLGVCADDYVHQLEAQLEQAREQAQQLLDILQSPSAVLAHQDTQE